MENEVKTDDPKTVCFSMWSVEEGRAVSFQR